MTAGEPGLDTMAGKLISVNLGIPTEASWATGTDGCSGIDKRPVTGRIALHTLGAVDDFIGDATRHGGPDQAVYAYAREDAAWWERELDRQIPPGGFGENISTMGVDVTGAVIGERWAIGSVLLEVSAPRIPCATFAGFWEVPDLVRRFTRRATPGAYLRVVVPGEVAVGDPVEVTERPAHRVTIGESFRALTTEPGLLPRLVDVPALPASVRERVIHRVAAGGGG